MAKKVEWVPWYRRKGYAENLTEPDKRVLDGFRADGKHPAVALEDLPEEAQGYIVKLEIDVYDLQQNAVVGRGFAATGIGAFLLFGAYHEIGWGAPWLGYILGPLIIGVGWIKCFRDHKKNAANLWIEQLWSKGDGMPFSVTHEKLQEHWDLAHLANLRRAKREAERAD
jgi:hypothetical protein